MIARERRQEIMADWPKGSMPPPGYVDWHEWAEAQQLHGLRSKKCKRCKHYYFPQQMEAHACAPVRAGYKAGRK